MLPHIEKCMFYARNSFKTQTTPKIYVPPTGPREYQVIVKATNYKLDPKSEYTGNWHVEGVLIKNLFVYKKECHMSTF